MDSVAKTNMVEAELDGFVARRDKERRRDEGERAREEIWAESCRRHHEQRQEQLALEWLAYHQQRQRAHRKTFALLDAMHAAEIAKYEAMLKLDGHESNEQKESA